MFSLLSIVRRAEGCSLKLISPLLAVLLVALSSTKLAQASDELGPSNRPNIVLIMSDDMGYSDIGCFGGEISTPRLDALAEQGIRFTQFYNTGRCCPTRASLLTGLYPHQTGMGHMTAAYSRRVAPGYTGDLNRKCRTIAEVLKPAGYATFMVGKWHVTSHDGPESSQHNWPRQRGFDRFYGTIKGGGSFYDPTSLCRDNTFITPENDERYQPKGPYYYTDAIADNGQMFVREHLQQSPDTPFFLYVSFTAAHWPMHARPEDIAKYQGKYGEGYAPVRQARFERMQQLGLVSSEWQLSPQAGDWSQARNKAWEARCMEVYAAMIDRMDQKIGELVDLLEAEGQLDKTLILFLQDNGGCAEGLGRGRGQQEYATDLKPMGRDELQPNITPPMRTRDGRPVRQGRGVMPGPADTYIAYGRNWANVSNTPFREYKHWVHEGGIATPLIAHWPRGIAASQQGDLNNSPAHLIDIIATCVDLAAAAYPTVADAEQVVPLAGVSLRPAFTGESLERRAPIFWEHEGNCAMREGKWKLVRKNNEQLPTEDSWELYDVEQDRTEMHDLADQHPDRVADMHKRWMAWAETAHVLPWPWTESAEEFNREQRVFQLRAGEALPRERAPYVVGVPFRVHVELNGPLADGVLVAQGGSADGWALYIDQGVPKLSLRESGQLTTVASNSVIPNTRSVAARIDADGRLEIEVDGEVVAQKNAPSGLIRMPVDGLEVGTDAKGTVGEYGANNHYQGSIRRVQIEIDKQ